MGFIRYCPGPGKGSSCLLPFTGCCRGRPGLPFHQFIFSARVRLTTAQGSSCQPSNSKGSAPLNLVRPFMTLKKLPVRRAIVISLT